VCPSEPLAAGWVWRADVFHGEEATAAGEKSITCLLRLNTPQQGQSAAFAASLVALLTPVCVCMSE
jgi:hypothetical protein